MFTLTTYSNPCSHLNFYPCSRCKSHSLVSSLYGLPRIMQHYPMLANLQGFPSPPCKYKSTKAMHASENSQSEPPVPDRPPSPEWKKWVVGILLSIVLPSFRHKWGPLLVLEDKVNTTVETVEAVTEAVEDLAEGVEKVADVVEDKLPDHDTKLKEVTESVENLAKETVKEAERVQEFAQKVEKLEEDVETLMEPGMDQAEVDGQKRAEDADVHTKE